MQHEFKTCDLRLTIYVAVVQECDARLFNRKTSARLINIAVYKKVNKLNARYLKRVLYLQTCQQKK